MPAQAVPAQAVPAQAVQAPMEQLQQVLALLVLVVMEPGLLGRAAVGRPPQAEPLLVVAVVTLGAVEVFASGHLRVTSIDRDLHTMSKRRKSAPFDAAVLVFVLHFAGATLFSMICDHHDL